MNDKSVIISIARRTVVITMRVKDATVHQRKAFYPHNSISKLPILSENNSTIKTSYFITMPKCVFCEL